VNDGPSERHVTVTLLLASRGGGYHTTLRLPDGTTREYDVSAARREVVLSLVLKPGDNLVRFDSAAPPGVRPLRGEFVQVLNEQVVDDDFERLSAQARPVQSS
jgi:hypothetical protein